MTEIARRIFNRQAFAWPASAGPVGAEVSKTLDLGWDGDTDMRSAKLEVVISQSFDRGVAAPILWNEREVSRMNWGAFDTSTRKVVVAVQPRRGPNNLTILPTTAQFVFPGSNQGGVVERADLSLVFVGEDPTTSAPRKTVGQIGSEFLSNLGQTAPWVLGLLAVLGVAAAIVVIKLRS